MSRRAAFDVDTVLDEPLRFASQAPRAIGYVGLDLPEDLLACPALVAVHLPWRRDAGTAGADRWLEDSFPGWARSILEDWFAGRFDFLQAVVFSRGDDTSQRLYYYVCELQRQAQLGGPAPLVYDVARIPRQSSREWTAMAIDRLATTLGLDAADLEQGIDAANRRRVALQERDADVHLAGRYRERIARASLFVPGDMLAVPDVARSGSDERRVLLAGSVPPDDGLHVAVEAAGWNVVADVHDRGLDRLGLPIESRDGSPAERIASHAHARRHGVRGFHDRAAQIAEVARERRVEAAILWLFEEDEAFAWDVVRVREALQDAGLPTLVLPRRRWDLADEPGAAIGRFLAGVDR